MAEVKGSKWRTTPGESLRPHHVNQVSPVQFPFEFKRAPASNSMSFRYDLGPKAKYKFLLDDPQVKRWYLNLRRGSLVCADNCIRRIGLFSERFHVTPTGLMKMQGQALSNFLMDAVTKMEEQGFAGAYILSHLKALKSWLKFNGVTVNIPIKVSDDSERVESVPTQVQLKKVLSVAALDTRAASALMAFSGVRPQVVGNYRGFDGLVTSDFVEAEIDNGNKLVTFKQVPTLIKVRKPISKARHQYHTFLCEEGCDILKAYWEKRMGEGETLSPDSPAIKPKAVNKKSKFLWAVRVSDRIHLAIKKAGFKWRPYVLRCFFDRQMMIAESKGLLIRDYRVYWMGHKGDIEHRYTLNKELPPSVITDLREAYKRAQRYIQTIPVSNDYDVKTEFRKMILQTTGYSEEEVKTLDIVGMNDEEFQSKIKEKLTAQKGKNGNSNTCNGKVKNKIVSVNELESYFEKGWEFVSQLPNEKAVIKLADDGLIESE